jgi:hypothetical protein
VVAVPAVRAHLDGSAGGPYAGRRLEPEMLSKLAGTVSSPHPSAAAVQDRRLEAAFQEQPHVLRAAVTAGARSCRSMASWSTS